jgi:ribosomal protein L21E
MDSLAAFFEMELIVEDGAQIRAGDLFNRYKDFCEEIKKPAMSLTTFSPGLEKLFNELHQPVIRDRSGRHVTFIGLRLRRENDEHPTHSQKLAAIAGLDTPNAGLDAGLNAGLATIHSKDLQDLQDLTPNIVEEAENSQQKLDASQETPKLEETNSKQKDFAPPTPAAPVQPLPSKGPSPASSPANSPVTPAPSPATKRNHKEFKVGDRVRIVERGLHHGKDGKVLVVYFGNTENRYKIALDKESHLQKEVTVRVPHSEKFPILMSL